MPEHLHFALNHMCAPKLGIEAFFAMAGRLGVDAVEIRNDLPGQAILDGTPAAEVRELAARTGLRIRSINALQRFNQWSGERAREADALIAYARECGAEALVLVPTNDGSGRANGERQANLRIALKELAPRLEEAGVTGLVEPLGFETCSLRLKSEAIEAIRALGRERSFALVHDTFHHHVAGETEIFPGMTGLVHVSGVTDASLAVADMRDGHRLLVDGADRIDNTGQIRAMLAGGYDGLFSFEPFAAAVHDNADIAGALRESIAFIERQAGRQAA